MFWKKKSYVLEDQEPSGRRMRDVPEEAAEPDPVTTPREELALRREEFGGLKVGAVFFGWLITVALTVLLVGIVSAIATGADSSLDVTQADEDLRSGSIEASTAIALLVILAIGYLAGGYVAGRLARFNGVRQGVGVWVFGLVITIVVVVVGAFFGDEYNVFDRASLPSLPVQTDEVTLGGLLALVGVLVGSFAAAVMGGTMGQRFHSKIDRTTL